MVHLLLGTCMLIAAAEPTDGAAKSERDEKPAAAELTGEFAAESKASTPRRWSDLSGKHSITASLIEVKEGKVHLKRSKGGVTAIDFAKLSDLDQLWVRAAIRSTEPPLSEEELDEPDYTEVNKLMNELKATGMRSLEPGLSAMERTQRQLDEARQGTGMAVKRERLKIKISLAQQAALNNTPRDQQKKAHSYLASAKQQTELARAMRFIEKVLALPRPGPEVAEEVMDAIDELRTR